MRCGELGHLYIPDDILDDLQCLFLEIRPRVANLAIFLKINIRKLSNREFLRRFWWRLREFLLQFLPRTHRDRSFDSGEYAFRESLVAKTSSEASSIRPILRTHGIFLTCTSVCLLKDYGLLSP